MRILLSIKNKNKNPSLYFRNMVLDLASNYIYNFTKKYRIYGGKKLTKPDILNPIQLHKIYTISYYMLTNCSH